MVKLSVSPVITLIIVHYRTLYNPSEDFRRRLIWSLGVRAGCLSSGYRLQRFEGLASSEWDLAV